MGKKAFGHHVTPPGYRQYTALPNKQRQDAIVRKEETCFIAF